MGAMTYDKWAHNRKFWETRKAGYPYIRRTHKKPLVTPTVVKNKCKGDILRVPIDEYVYWGFTIREDYDMFVGTYGGEEILS